MADIVAVEQVGVEPVGVQALLDTIDPAVSLNRVEIWDTQAWNDYLAGAEQPFSEQAEEVVPGLL